MISNANALRCFLIIFLFFTPISIVYPQGIKFEQGLTWQQIVEKSKKENKYIFVDCFATWCGPCKQMDKEVYTSEKVGALFNENFISIKLQMDTTKQDNTQIQSWYNTASTIKSAYNIVSFPTYLFFSPEGTIVDKNVGYFQEMDFITLAKNSLNPQKQYYTLLKNYQSGKKDYSILRNLALKAKHIGEKDVADNIARDYINNFLSRQKETELYTEKNIVFIQDFLTAKDRYFNLFYHHREKVDKAMNEKGYAQKIVDWAIYRETIYPLLKIDDENSTSPDWYKIQKITTEKYGPNDAHRNILSAQLKWYEYKKNWLEYEKVVVLWVGKYKENLNWLDLNTCAWTIFLHSNKKNLLDSALTWSSLSIELIPSNTTSEIANLIDTKANILFKLGRTAEAISMEKKAITLANEQKAEFYIKEFTDNLRKMTNGEPTWITSAKTTE